MATKKLKETERLLKVVGELRRKCPWDKKQTHRTLMPYLVEEAYETLDAIEEGSPGQLKEELGDVLLQVALHAEIAGEKGKFTFEEVAGAIADKMIHRHPHIYQTKQTRKLKDHLRTWTQLKSAEKPSRGLLEGIPKAMPSLQRSQRYGEIASSVGLEDTPKAMLRRLKESLKTLEAQASRPKADRRQVNAAVGEMVFQLAGLARQWGVDAEAAGRQRVDGFGKAFSQAEGALRKRGVAPTDATESDWRRVWRGKTLPGR